MSLSKPHIGGIKIQADPRFVQRSTIVSLRLNVIHGQRDFDPQDGLQKANREDAQVATGL